MDALLNSRIIIGYHGCDKSTAENVILNSGSIPPSLNEYDWLGQGVYFWEYGLQRAYEWAEVQKKRGRVETPFVLGAYISLGRCFDLADTDATSQLHDFYHIFKDYVEKSDDMPMNRPAYKGDKDFLIRNLDCAVINYGMQLYDTSPEETHLFQTVRGIFQEGKPVYPGAQILGKTHIQVAVRDQSCILGYFLPHPISKLSILKKKGD